MKENNKQNQDKTIHRVFLSFGGRKYLACEEGKYFAYGEDMKKVVVADDASVTCEKCKEKMNRLCACGCGQKSNGKKFLLGHSFF